MILYLVALVWALRLIINILSYAHLWYVKEYRWDRMWIHLARTKQGKQILFPARKVPPLSPKSLLLCILLGSYVLAVLFFVPLGLFWNLLVADLTLFPVSAIAVLLLTAPTVLYHEIVIRRAVAMLRSHKPMTVVGITGSFGKTSTKEFLHTILSSRFRTLKTAASKNSPIGIAEVVLSDLRPDHEAFIVEMGAYRPGEIARMSSMVRPSVAVITAVNAQHQDLFRTIETTMKAKYELVAGLAEGGVAIFNADNAYTREMASWAHKDGKRVWLYTTGKAVAEKWVERVFSAQQITADDRHISFTARTGGEKHPVSAEIRGEHFAQNLLGAIAAAVAAGMPFAQACSAAGKAVSVPKVMQPVAGPSGIRLINDTFNNNPDAAKAAILFLSKAKKKKVLVFQPMIELGSYADASHEDVGKYAARYCDEIILTNNNFSEPFIRGAQSVRTDIPIRILTAKAAADYLRKTYAAGDTVLFKGKEAEFVLKEMLR